MSPLDSTAVALEPVEPRVQLGLAEAAARRSPDDWQTLLALGHARRVAGLLRQAVVAFQRAAARADLAGAPAAQRARILANLALAHLDRSEDPTALETARLGIALDSDCAAAQLNAGVALHRLGEDGAEGHLERAIALAPADPAPRNALGLLRHRAGDPTGAERLIRSALARMPGDGPEAAPVQANLGRVLRAQGRLDDAWAAFDRAARLAPGTAEHRFNRSVVRLLQGRLGEAWEDHEARRDMGEYGREAVLPIPEWRGEPIAGRRILLRAEQGLGDTIQFVRYARLLQAMGAHVTLGVPAALAHILRTVPGVATVLPDGATVPPVDVQAMLLSLPHRFGTTLETVPADTPYVRAEPDLVTAWGARLNALPGRRVGLVWAGNPKHRNDRNRSIPPGLLDGLAAVPGISWVSLQVGPRGAEAADTAMGRALHDFTDGLTEFAETAALLEALDDVVAVDTSVAHLAGALGRPTSLLLPADPDWRWMCGRADTPWYPTLTLYRQERAGDWSVPLARLAARLAGGSASAAPPSSATPRAHP